MGLNDKGGRGPLVTLAANGIELSLQKVGSEKQSLGHLSGRAKQRPGTCAADC